MKFINRSQERRVGFRHIRKQFKSVAPVADREQLLKLVKNPITWRECVAAQECKVPANDI